MSSRSTVRPTRLAFIGTGDWARQYHLPSLKHIREHKLGGAEVVLHGIYGIRQDEAAELATAYGFGRVYRSLGELVQDADVDAVVVVITPEAVRDVLLKLVPKRVPLMTEKPPGANLAEARELAERVTVTNVVCFNRRYGLLNNRFRERIRQMPGIAAVRGAMFRKNRREAHFVLHTAVHLINFMEYLFGPIRILRNHRRAHPVTGGREHVAAIGFESGLEGEILISPCSDRHWEGIEVDAADQTLVLHSPHNDAPGEIILRPRRPGDGNGQILDRSGSELPILEEGYAWEYVDFLNARATGAATRSNLSTSVNTMRIAEAIETGLDLE